MPNNSYKINATPFYNNQNLTYHYTYGDTVLGQPILGGVFNFNYTGGVQTWTVPQNLPGVTLEVWGAQGGYRSSSTYGGKGGYSKGYIPLKAGDVLYVYVGGSGNTGGTSGGVERWR